ncbi:exodeoxyribonuclease III [Thiobacter aerophilum]|uniref:Exodeoxyribonuclease III n=1 Tax=Thiobacter aerophilum TaxID=3121275 RepID=A0ABV0EG48_9BURK
MKIATWNVNSLKVRLPQLLDWLERAAPHVVCLQETKLEDHAFPVKALQEAGYESVFAGQKTYNGVAILSRTPQSDVSVGIPGFSDDQKRVLASTIAGIRFVCLYVPNGQAVGSDKYAYKLKWLAALAQWLRLELARHPNMALLGDFNIAPEPRDVHDPALWEGHVLFSEPERAAFRDLLALGFKDAFRLFEQPEKSFTWWDYRMMAFRRNHGLRIDHILLSEPLARSCASCSIERELRKLERPSDHAPVIAELKT